MRFGAWLDAAMTASEVVDVCRRVEAGSAAGDLPLDSVWISEAYVGRDAVALAAVAAHATSRLRVATAIVNPYTRHPVMLAMTALTMNEIAPGRFVLGIGAGESHWMEALGYDLSRPLTRVREAAREIRDVLAGTPVERDGSRARLIVRDPDTSLCLQLAAIGPRMCALAGAEFDGCILPVATPHLVATAAAEIRAAEHGAGRPEGTCEIVATLLFAAGDDEEALLGRMRRKLGLMLTGPGAGWLLERNGVDPEEAERFHRAIAHDGLRAALRTLPDAVVEPFCVIGGVDECAGRLAAYADAGLDLAALLCEPDQVDGLLAVASRLSSATDERALT